MIDLHTHSLFSDGELVPSELIQRFEALSYEYVAITDHGDISNIDFIIPRIARVAEELNKYRRVQVLPGIELTHVPPETIADLAREARKLGAKIVAVHGESPVEPVPAGTNRAAVEADIDFLAHPGLITEEEARIAAERGVFLEITARKGHSLTNGHVARMARKTSAELILNTDSHAPGDLITREFGLTVVRGAGLDEEELEKMLERSRRLARRALGG